MKFRLALLSAVILTACVLFFGCKADDDDDSPVIAVFSGVVVDPYIEGAVFCEDKNNNGGCDEDEQLSTASSASGVFTFPAPITAGSALITYTKGAHNGVAYTIDLVRKIDSTANVGRQVVSPLTTLAARDLTDDQIATMLQNVGLTSITADDVTADPMAGIALMTGAITEDQVVKLQSSIAVYAFLRIMSGSSRLQELTGTELYNSATTNGEAVNQILTAMVAYVKQGLDPDLITNIQSQLDQAPVSLPSASMEDVAKTAVAITDYIAKTGYETCNATAGDDAAKVTAALTAVQTKTDSGNKISGWASQLGARFYAARNKSDLEQYRAWMGAFTDVIAGMDCESGVFVINDSGDVGCYTE